MSFCLVAAVQNRPGVGSSKSFNITNSCSYTVWPRISSGAGSAAALDSTGFELARHARAVGVVGPDPLQLQC
jgi:hypothetical protein